jgi:hypothetical protein
MATKGVLGNARGGEEGLGMKWRDGGEQCQ